MVTERGVELSGRVLTYAKQGYLEWKAVEQGSGVAEQQGNPVGEKDVYAIGGSDRQK